MNSTTQIHNQKTAPFASQIVPACIMLVGARERRPCRSDFDLMLLETADSVFSALGSPCKEAIYAALETGYGLKRDAIPRNVKTFAKALEDIFEDASLLLEAKIIRMLHCRVNAFKFRSRDRQLSFVDYLESMRSRLK